MVWSTNLSLRVLAVSTVTSIAAGFGTIVPLPNKFGRHARQRPTLWLHKGGDNSLSSFRDGVDVPSKIIEDDGDQISMATPVVGGVPQRSALNEGSRTEKHGGAENDDRAGALRKLLASLGAVGNTDEGMPAGSNVVVSELSLPDLGLYEWQSYELVSVYDQGVDDNGLPVKIPRGDLNAAPPSPSGYRRYCTLYSARYHEESGPAVVSTDEIRLVSVQSEVVDSLLMALPVFGFWTALAVSFANVYNERYGGNFLDALFRT